MKVERKKKGVERNVWMCWKKGREKRFWETEKRVSEKGWELSDDEVDIGERVDDGIDAWIHIYCLRSSPFSDSLKRNLYKKQINRHNLVWSGELCAWEWHKRPWKNILRKLRDAESVLYLHSQEANTQNFMQEKNTIKSIRLKIIIKYYNSINKQLNLRNITRNGWIQETSGDNFVFCYDSWQRRGNTGGNLSSFNIHEQLVLTYKNPSYIFYRHQVS